MKNTQKYMYRVGMFIFLAVLTVICLYPLLLTLSVSFKAQSEVWSNFFGLPQKLLVQNYVDAWKKANIGAAFFNSFYITVITICAQILLASMAAYLIARVDLGHHRVNSWLFYFFALGTMIPVHAILLPIARRAVNLHMTDSHLYLLLVYISGGLPWLVFLISGYMRSIPQSMEEAAMIDGGSLATVFFRIIFPLSKPILATATILMYLGTWNELLIAMVLLKSAAKKTLSMALAAFTGFHSINYPQLTAAIVISIVPTLILYFIFQERVEKGLLAGAVKG